MTSSPLSISPLFETLLFETLLFETLLFETFLFETFLCHGIQCYSDKSLTSRGHTISSFSTLLRKRLNNNESVKKDYGQRTKV